MAKHDRHIEAAGDADFDVSELLRALGKEREDRSERQRAIACFLSGSKGWKEAADHLGGSFAKLRATETGLIESKEA